MSYSQYEDSSYLSSLLPILTTAITYPTLPLLSASPYYLMISLIKTCYSQFVAGGWEGRHTLCSLWEFSLELDVFAIFLSLNLTLLIKFTNIFCCKKFVTLCVLLWTLHGNYFLGVVLSLFLSFLLDKCGFPPVWSSRYYILLETFSIQQSLVFYVPLCCFKWLLSFKLRSVLSCHFA